MRKNAGRSGGGGIRKDVIVVVMKLVRVRNERWASAGWECECADASGCKSSMLPSCVKADESAEGYAGFLQGSRTWLVRGG